MFYYDIFISSECRVLYYSDIKLYRWDMEEIKERGSLEEEGRFLVELVLVKF